MPAILKTKLAPKDLANPKKIAGTLDESNPRVFVGTFIGIATGLSQRADPKDETNVYEGLRGSFVGEPVEGDAVRSGILYLPDSIHDIMAASFKGDNPAEQLEFGLNVYLEKATNPQGYSWAFQNIVEPETKDPVEELSRRIMEKQKALPAPDKAANKAKAKR